MLTDIMYGLAEMIHPTTYLEVGVREGASLISATLTERGAAHFAKACLTDGETMLTKDMTQRINEAFTIRESLKRIIVFDKWIQNRTDGQHIINLIEGFKSNVQLELHSGDSRKTLPEFFKDEPDLIIDLVLVDGGHDDEIISADLNNLNGHFRVLAAHDTYNEEYPNMKSIVKDFANKNNYPLYFLGEMFVGTAVLLNLSINH